MVLLWRVARTGVITVWWRRERNQSIFPDGTPLKTGERLMTIPTTPTSDVIVKEEPMSVSVDTVDWSFFCGNCRLYVQIIKSEDSRDISLNLCRRSGSRNDFHFPVLLLDWKEKTGKRIIEGLFLCFSLRRFYIRTLVFTKAHSLYSFGRSPPLFEIRLMSHSDSHSLLTLGNDLWLTISVERTKLRRIKWIFSVDWQ